MRFGAGESLWSFPRIAAVGSLGLVAALVAVVLATTLSAGRGGAQRASTAPSAHNRRRPPPSGATPNHGTASVPILDYHVINSPPAGSAANPDLYVPTDQFSSQMSALKAAGWHAVTLNQLEAYWTRGTSLGAGKPIVITFDDGYASQYTNALPVLKQLGWPGVENLPVTGLPPSEGGLTDAQIRALVAAGWELDTQGAGDTSLTGLDSGQLQSQVATARQTLRSRYGVPVNWFSYPSGQYDPTIVAAVRAAGFVGATTVVPGWASPHQDPFMLPRLEVLPGTSASQLLAQIAAAQADTTIPSAYSGPSIG